MNIDEILSADDARHYMCCLALALKSGKEVCSYNIKDHVFVVKMFRISDRRVRVCERDVTGLKLSEVLKLF